MAVSGNQNREKYYISCFENLNLKTIIGRAISENIASIKVLEKIGLKFEREFDFDKSNKGVIYRINK